MRTTASLVPTIAVDPAQASPRRGSSGWLLSAGIHASALIFAWIAVQAPARLIEHDDVQTRVNPLPTVEKKEEKIKPPPSLEPQPDVPQISESETPAVAVVDVVDVVENPIEDFSDNHGKQGHEDAIAATEMGGPGMAMSLGSGGSASGLMGNRKSGHKSAGLRYGANKASDNAVERSLRWFKRHQSPNGSWESDTYYQNCTEGIKCEPGKLHDASDANVAMTGYAVLCFLGFGQDHKMPGRYRSSIKNGIAWLLSVQSNDGYFGRRNYEHSIAVMALAEAYAMTGDPDLRAAVQKGVDQILAHQNQDSVAGPDGYVGGLGWDYNKPNDRNDSSVTGWNVMALKSAFAGGLNVGRGMDGAKCWLVRHWQVSNSSIAPQRAGDKQMWKDAKDITAYDKSRFFYTWHHRDDKLDGDSGRESIGLACAVFLGHMKGDPLVESLANTVSETQLPKAFPTNAYYLYYNTLGVFQLGGERWKTWNATVRDLLVHAQCQTNDCRDGSWDWQGGGFHGSDLGRVLTTAYNTLSLEVYYRYKQLEDLHK